MTGTERKVFQKYYPPDFDPTKLPRAKGQKNRQWVQRVMTPFNMRCNTCNEYIYKGKKFNMKREPADEFYLGMRIWRFYFRCPNCLAEISFKTDLENCDYQAENGATRLFEAFKLWKDSEKAKEEKEEEDKNDPMKMLEKRTKMSRAEMEAMGKLEEIQELNRRHEGATLAVDDYLEKTDERLSLAEQLKRQEEADEAEIRELYGRMEDGKYAKRIKEEEEDEMEAQEMKDVKKVLPRMEMQNDVKKRLADQRSLISKLIVTKKAKTTVKEEPKDEDDPGPSSSSLLASSSNGRPPPTTNGLAGLVGYGSDSSDSD